MAHAMAQFFGSHPLGPWGGAKRSNIIKSQSQSQFQRFLKFRRLGHAPGVGLGGTVGGGGGLGGPNTFFSQIQPDLVCELLT